MLELPVLLVAIILIGEGDGYCAGAGANPGFKAAPHVEQVRLTSVLVSWDGLVTRIECADQFLVKSWLYSNPNEYKISELLPTDVFSHVVEDLLPGNQYMFQVVAREDKGLLGKDWNKSTPTKFSTSPANPTVRPPTRHRSGGGVGGGTREETLAPSPAAKSETEGLPGGGGGLSGTEPGMSLGRAPETDGNARPLSTVILLTILTLVGFLALLVVGAVYNTMRLMMTRRRAASKTNSFTSLGTDSGDYQLDFRDTEDEQDRMTASGSTKNASVQTRYCECACSSPEISRKEQQSTPRSKSEGGAEDGQDQIS